MKKAAIVIGIIIITAILLYYKFHPLSATVTIKGKIYLVDLALTEKDKDRGLSGRTNMPDNRGMLFIYDHKSKYPFWMKGMQFPLDFLWLSGNQIVDITKNVPITSEGTIPEVTPTVEVDKVIELNAGEIDAIGIIIGDTVLFNK